MEEDIEKKFELLNFVRQIETYEDLEEGEDKWYIYLLELEDNKFYIDKTKYPLNLKTLILNNYINISGFNYKIIKIKDVFIGSEENEEMCYENNYRLYLNDLMKTSFMNKAINDLSKTFEFLDCGNDKKSIKPKFKKEVRFLSHKINRIRRKSGF